MVQRSRVVRSALAAGAASAALSLAGPDALVPFKDATAAAATVGVAFVVDFASGAPVIGCAHVPSSDNGYAALEAFTQQANLAAPTYNAAGLLCSIGGIPSNGCGQQVGSSYDYWSYWHGVTGSWFYSEVGAFATVQSGDVEGWRWEDPGHANPNDPPPNAAPDYAAICPATTTATTSGQPAASSSPGPANPSSSGGSASGAPTAAASTPSAAGSDTPTGAAPGSHTAGSAATQGARGDGQGGAATTTTTSAPTRESSPPVRLPDSGTGAAALGAAPAGARNPGGGSGAAPLAIGGILVLALVAAAVWRWRARPRTP